MKYFNWPPLSHCRLVGTYKIDIILSPITKLCAQALSLIPSNEDGWQHQCCSISFSTKPRATLDLLNRHHVGKACNLFLLCIRCTKDQSSALHERKIEKGERWINLRSSHRTTLIGLRVGLWAARDLSPE